MLFGGFLVPLLVICISYTCLVFELKSRGRNLNRYEMENLSQLSIECDRHELADLSQYDVTQRDTNKEEIYATKAPYNQSFSSLSSKYKKKSSTSNNSRFSDRKSSKKLIQSMQKRSIGGGNIYSLCEAKAIKTGILSVTAFCFAWFPYSVIKPNC